MRARGGGDGQARGRVARSRMASAPELMTGVTMVGGQTLVNGLRGCGFVSGA